MYRTLTSVLANCMIRSQEVDDDGRRLKASVHFDFVDQALALILSGQREALRDSVKGWAVLQIYRKDADAERQVLSHRKTQSVAGESSEKSRLPL